MFKTDVVPSHLIFKDIHGFDLGEVTLPRTRIRKGENQYEKVGICTVIYGVQAHHLKESIKNSPLKIS